MDGMKFVVQLDSPEKIEAYINMLKIDIKNILPRVTGLLFIYTDNKKEQTKMMMCALGKEQLFIYKNLVEEVIPLLEKDIKEAGTWHLVKDVVKFPVNYKPEN